MRRVVPDTEPRVIRCVEGRLDPSRPWTMPEGAAVARMVLSSSGKPPRRATAFQVARDDRILRIVFDAEDEREVVATMRDHDDPLWKEDVFEVFIAPERRREYFELELSPLGARFDAKISSPGGSRSTMQTDLSWGCTWRGFVRRDGADGRWRTRASLEIPFDGLGIERPDSGAVWWVNFYRIDRSSDGDEYSSWAPTLADPPDFHLPDRFGELHFV